MSEALKVVASVANEAEAEMIRVRLAEVGIQAVAQRAIGGPEWGWSGGRYVYVEEADVERAKALLKADEEAFTDEELTRLSEEAGSDAEEP